MSRTVAPHESEEFSPDEAQRRFRTTIRAAFNLPPKTHTQVQAEAKKAKTSANPASAATGKTARRRSGNQAS